MEQMLSFVIPVLNEQDSIKLLYEKIMEQVRQQEYLYEILFIDDGSTDDSALRVKELREKDKNVHLIMFRKNFGKAMALQTGFRNAQGDIIITMDADLQDDPCEIPRFVEKIN